MWSDRLDIALDDNSGFAGAVATGNVSVIDGKSVLTCERIELDADQIRGTILGATVRIKRRVPRGPHDDAGRNRATFYGDIQRTDPNHLEIRDAEFTLCDCTPEPPSWRVNGSKIDVEMGHRATIYAPRLSIRPFGLFDLPITPPMLPLSVPLKRRAPGLLAPRLGFLELPYPTIDLPLFLPLGESWT